MFCINFFSSCHYVNKKGVSAVTFADIKKGGGYMMFSCIFKLLFLCVHRLLHQLLRSDFEILLKRYTILVVSLSLKLCTVSKKIWRGYLVDTQEIQDIQYFHYVYLRFLRQYCGAILIYLLVKGTKSDKKSYAYVLLFILNLYLVTLCFIVWGRIYFI